MKATTGKRFSEAAKQRILAYINKQGRGGIKKAVEKYGVTYPSVKRWISGVGIENPVKMAPGILNGEQKNLNRKPCNWEKRKLVKVGQTWNVKVGRGKNKVMSVVITGKTTDREKMATVYTGKPVHDTGTPSDERGEKMAPITFTNDQLRARLSLA